MDQSEKKAATARNTVLSVFSKAVTTPVIPENIRHLLDMTREVNSNIMWKIVSCYVGECIATLRDNVIDEKWIICMYEYMYVYAQCLVAARDGHDAESSSASFAQLYKLEELLIAGAIPNATMVSTIA